MTSAPHRRRQPVFRFAPSPNGLLHLGHAYSALTNLRLARQLGGKLLLRIEDIDRERCTPALEDQMLADLEWIGFEWDEAPLRQSDRFEAYRAVLDDLLEQGLLYPATMSRSQIRHTVARFVEEGKIWPTDPDGVAHYPGNERELATRDRIELARQTADCALRLDMAAADRVAGEIAGWRDEGSGPDGETGQVAAEPMRWGDVVLGRKSIPASYHLSCVVDDAYQDISHVVRGRDLFHATSVHRLLQVLLDLPTPIYHHHDLILGEGGAKLSKSRADTALAHLRDAGAQPADIRRMIGIAEE